MSFYARVDSVTESSASCFCDILLLGSILMKYLYCYMLRNRYIVVNMYGLLRAEAAEIINNYNTI